MKISYLFWFLFVLSCANLHQNVKQEIEEYYFYFDTKMTDQILKKYTSFKDGPTNYLYNLHSDIVIFTPKSNDKGNDFKRLKIKDKDTIELNIKHIDWLNRFNNIQLDSIFLKKSNKKFHIIEKDTLDNQLYLIEVIFIQEIE